MIVAALGALAFAVAHLVDGSAGAVAWSVALVVACLGFGIALERVALRQALGTTIVCGLVVLCTLSLALAFLGCLAPPVQLALVGLGIAGCALPRARAEHHTPPPPLAVLAAIAAGAVLVVIAALLCDVPTGDDMNHVFYVKRLADTGRLTAVHHGAGLQLVAESYWCLARGARDAAVFEQGACAGLVLLLLAELCRARLPVFAVAAACVVTAHPLVDGWSGVALLLGCYLALVRALEVRRIGWQAIAIAVGLALARHEYVLVALPLIATALALPRRDRPSPRGTRIAAGAWLAVVIPLQLALAVPLLHAAIVAVVLVACVPLAALVLHVAGLRAWRPPIGPLLCGALLLSSGVALDAIRAAQHAPIATISIWLVLGLVIAAEAADAPALVATALLVIGVVWLPNWSPEKHQRIVDRVGRAADLLAHPRVTDEAGLRELQRAAPAHARLGFWGRSADELDFARNPIRDVSFPFASRRNRDYLMQLSATSLAAIDYVVVENVRPSRLLDATVADPWGANSTAIDAVRERLVVVASNGHGALYRIGRR